MQRSASVVLAFLPLAISCPPCKDIELKNILTAIRARIPVRQSENQRRERFQPSDSFRAVMAKSSPYVFQPRWIRYIDNTRRFGFKFEIGLPVAQEEK